MDGLCTVGMWEMRWARDLVGGWAVYCGDVGDGVGTRSRTCHGGWVCVHGVTAIMCI